MTDTEQVSEGGNVFGFSTDARDAVPANDGEVLNFLQVRYQIVLNAFHKISIPAIFLSNCLEGEDGDALDSRFFASGRLGCARLISGERPQNQGSDYGRTDRKDPQTPVATSPD